MKRFGISFAPSALVLPLLLFQACGSGGSPSTLDPNAPVSPTYSSISSVILQNGCVSCHGGAGGYSFDSYANTLKAVVAGSPASSPLYTTLASGKMPESGTHPSSTQLQAISSWISAGAQNN